MSTFQFHTEEEDLNQVDAPRYSRHKVNIFTMYIFFSRPLGGGSKYRKTVHRIMCSEATQKFQLTEKRQIGHNSQNFLD